MSVPRPEYPRPQFRRRDWTNLNGPWHFAFDDDDRGLDDGWHRASAAQLDSGSPPFDRRIIVPFCFQARLSGIGEPGFHDLVWYGRLFPTPSLTADSRLLLHFGAVDYQATVWVNGEQVAVHEGGHTPFQADVTCALRPPGRDNVLIVRAADPGRDRTIPRGKQTWKDRSEHIFYTRTTGIWQTVWLEPVNRRHIAELRLTPDLDEACLIAEVKVERVTPGLRLRLVASLSEAPVVDEYVAVTASSVECRLDLGNGGPGRLALWSPEQPTLYDLQLQLIEIDGTELDLVDSYFGMRKIEIRGPEVYLNDQPCYQRLILDQGYFPAGLMTAPSDDDLRRDIALAKAMGFSGARKHQKVEDPRWLYWADTLGFLVWGEMANAYAYSTDYVRRITSEWADVVLRDYNHPCIVTWVPMNESAGGRLVDAEPLRVEHLLTLYHLTRSLDSTRPVVSNDGWEHARSDLCTIHDYGGAASLARRYAARETSVAPAPPTPSPYHEHYAYDGEPVLVTEFGGILWGGPVAGLAYSVTEDAEEFLRMYKAMVDALLASDIVQGFCYTQLTDVEQEVNGLLTADRRPKVDLARIRAITAQERPATPGDNSSGVQSGGSPLQK